MAGKPYSARAAKVTVTNGDGISTTLLASRVTVSTNSDLIDVANFESGEADGVFYGDWIGGITSAEIMIEAYDSDTAGAVNNDIWALNLRAGLNNTIINVYPDFDNNPGSFWGFDPCTIIDIGTDVEVHGAVKLHIRARSRGVIVYPT